MLDIGISELLLIAIVALVVIGPKDLPVVMRHVMKVVRELRAVYLGFKHQMVQVLDEAGLNDLQQNMTTIIDLEGKPQKAYNVAELEHLGQAKPVDAHALDHTVISDDAVMTPLPPAPTP